MESCLFCCPICGGPLQMEKTRLFCENGHSFDRARQGYTHLLPPNRMHSKEPGDTKEMVNSRRAFLESGSYDCFAEKLCGLAVEFLQELPEPFLLDAGCGEGYYTDAVRRALPPEADALVCGFEFTKLAVAAAAKRSG